MWPASMMARYVCGAKSLYIAQDEKQISIWAKNNKDELGYLAASVNEVDNGRAATLLPAGQATAFSAAVSRHDSLANVKQMIIANEQSGNLSLLEQSLDTDLWRREPFYAEEAGNLMPIQSYTINITVTEDGQSPLSGGQVFITSSSVLSSTINGRLETLDTRGQWCCLDTTGELTLIIPTNGITSQPLQVTKARNSSGQEISLRSKADINPSQKVVKAFGALTSVDALSNATTQDNRSIWDGMEKPSTEDLKRAAQCFSAITAACTVLPQDGSLVKVSAIALKDAATALKEAKREVHDGLEAVVDLVMDGFHWVKENMDEALEWVVRKAGEAYEFVCKIGNSIKIFALNCLEKVTEAASWVWGKLKLGWEKLVELAGFLFSWQDILDTKDTIKELLNAGLDYAEFKVEGVNEKINDIQGMVSDITSIASGDAAKRVEPSNGSQDSEMQTFQQSPATKWIGERMKNGSSSVNSKTQNPKDPEIINMWDDRIQPLMKSFTDVAQTLAKDISQLFKGNNNMSTEQLLSKLSGNFLIGVLEVVKKLLNTLVTIVGKLVGLVKDIGNARLDWGFLNDLYKWLTRGSDLSIFDAISLLIAIPSTFIIKIVTGRKPPNLGKIDRKLFETSVVTSKKGSKKGNAGTTDLIIRPSTKDVTTIILGCGCGAAVIKLTLDNIKLMWKMVNKGIPAGVDSLSPSAIIEVMLMCIDAWSIYKDICDPPGDNVPGAELRRIATYMKCFRLASNAIYMLAGKAGFENEVADQIMLVIDLLTALVNCGLYTTVYVKELDATSWKGHDEEGTLVNGTNMLLETIAGVGYFTAFTFKEKQPYMTVVGLACMKIAAVGAIVTKAVEFRIAYKKQEGSS